MSRIGRQPITLPAKVDIKVAENNTITVKGPKGELTRTLHPAMTLKNDNGVVTIERPDDERQNRALHGLTRALVANMVKGVSEGFRRTLLIEGVGYRAEVRGTDLVMKLGYSHDVVVPPPAGITFVVPPESRGTTIHIDGANNEVVGQLAANVRNWRPPEPYLGKGVRYQGEIVRRKAGKAGKK
jgi:large subunit ribosomal protein L6